MSTSVVATPVANKPTEFSDEERAALAELHKRLPEVFESAAKQTTKPVEKAIWGVPLEPSLNDPRTDVVLVKFLRARTLDADAAAKMLADTLQWRSDFEINALLDEEFPEDIFKNIGVVYGKDRRGRPVTYNFYGSPECKEGFKDIERFLRWRIQLMEKGVRQLDFVNVADMVQVHDYDGVGIFSYDRNARTASRETIKIMSDNYPETLSIKYFINIPSWGETIYNLISRWLSEETRRKFIIVSKGNTTKALLENIDAAELYPSYRPKESEPSSSSSQSPSQSPPPAAAEPGQVAEEELMIPTDAAVGPAKDTNTVKATAITNDTHGLGGRKIDEPTTAAKGAADDSADKTSAS